MRGSPLSWRGRCASELEARRCWTGRSRQIGSQYSLILNALNCSSGALLAGAQTVAKDKNHVLGALGNVAASIREKLGESPSSIKKFNTLLEEVTTPSL